MLNLENADASASKCFVTHGTLSHIDAAQPPRRNKPFSTVLGQAAYQKLELILPSELWKRATAQFEAIPAPVFSRVILPLGTLVEGEFFNEYIKKGNILMLSEGRPGVDNVYSLREGILTLRLDRESYERAGIVGKPDGVKGKRGSRPRWVVEINLRLPSMLHGKKGFDRIVYAFKNALTTPVAWLFANVGNTSPSPDPLDKHFPTRVTCNHAVSDPVSLKVPPLQPPVDTSDDHIEFDEFCMDTYEWLSLISLDSPRVRVDDAIDPYLSRYAPPVDESSTLSEVVKVTWQGFLPPTWVHQVLVASIGVSKDSWVALSACGFNRGWSPDYRDCTVLKLPGRVGEYLQWEVAEI